MPTLSRFAFTLFIVSAPMLGYTSDAEACMPGFSHPQKEVMIFWHDGTEIIVWRARVTPASGGALGASEASATPTPPRTQLAWVLAVPSAPLAYHVVDNDDFDRTNYWAAGLNAVSPFGGRGGGDGSGGGLDVGETVRVGEYDVTPIQAEAGGAADALNRWLRRHRFPEANAEAVGAYASEGATFLAVKARVPRGTSNLDLRPIAIAFRSPQIVLPVRLSAGEEPFGLNATVVSTRVPDVASGLSHGLGAGPLRPHHAQADAAVGQVSIVPRGNVPAEMRHLIAPVTSEVPGFDRMLTGSLAVSLLSAQPLSIDVAAPDPTIALGDEVAADAPASVAHEGHWDQLGNFVLGAAAQEATPSAEAAAQEPEPAPAPPPRAAAEDDGGLCSATGRASTKPLLAMVLAGAMLVLRRRRGRLPR